MAGKNLKFIRRKTTDGTYYFIVNNTANDIDETVVLQKQPLLFCAMDPLNGHINLLPNEQQKNATAVRLQLKSGESIISKTAATKKKQLQLYKYQQPAGETIKPAKQQLDAAVFGRWSAITSSKKMTGIKP